MPSKSQSEPESVYVYLDLNGKHKKKAKLLKRIKKQFNKYENVVPEFIEIQEGETGIMKMLCEARDYVNNEKRKFNAQTIILASCHPAISSRYGLTFHEMVRDKRIILTDKQIKYFEDQTHRVIQNTVVISCNHKYKPVLSATNSYLKDMGFQSKE